MDGMFKVTEEQGMLRDLVKKFVRNELMPLEKNILDRFASGQPAALSDEENQKLFKQCKDLGLWALDVPEEAGGANLPAVALVGVNEELGYTCVPFTFPPDSPNLHMMLQTVNSGAAQEVSRALCCRRDDLGDCDLGAGRGRRSGGHEDQGSEGRRSLGDQRPQDLDQPHRQGRLHDRDGGDRSRARLARRHHRLPGRQGHARPGGRAGDPDAGRRSAPTRSCSRIAACTRARCSDGSAPASRRCSSASPCAACRWARGASAWPSARST